MPIAYARLTFLNLLPDGGACKALAYLGRTAIRDQGMERMFDFTGIAEDLVYEALLLPDGAPFATVSEFANALDGEERSRQRRDVDRERWPQVGASLVLALPPDPVLTLGEGAELVKRVVRLACGGSSALPVYVAIHDPAVETPGAVNRHAHIFFALRAIEGAGLSRTKVRDLFAQPRHAGDRCKTSSYVAEGLHWPSLARDLQTQLLAEIGSAAVVDPPAPVAGRHWSARTLREAPELRDHHNKTLLRENLKLIDGPPVELIARMLRGRSLMRIDEVHRLLARFLDGGDDREQRLHAILTDPGIVAFSGDPEASRPRWVTTRLVQDLTRKAAEAVDRTTIHAGEAPHPGLPVARIAIRSSASAVVDELERLLSAPPRAIHRPLVVGRNHSDCGPLAARLADAEPIVGTFASLNTTLSPSLDGGRRLETGPDGVIIVPRAENAPDQDLARLIVLAERHGAHLLLGFDISRAAPSCSLASGLADKFREPGESEAIEPAAALRAGLVAHACRALHEAGRLRFGGGDREVRGDADFLVVDDVDRLRSAYRDPDSSPRETVGATTFDVDIAGGRQLLRRDAWIVYTRDDYATPHTRAGRFARVVASRSPASLSVIHPDGTDATLDLHAYPHIRPADTISIREARHAPQDGRLLIEVTRAQHAWSAAVLAADRGTNAIIDIEPSVARDIDEWIAAVARSKPAPPLTALTPARSSEDIDIRFDDWVERIDDLFPARSRQTPHHLPDAPAALADSAVGLAAAAPAPLTEEQRVRLHDDVRKVLHSNADTRLGLARLQSALASDNPAREVIADDLLRVCPDGTASALLVQALMGRQERRESGKLDELELAEEMTAMMPRAWSAWELWALRMDLATMASTYSHWPMPPGPLAGRRRLPRADALAEPAEVSARPDFRV